MKYRVLLVLTPRFDVDAGGVQRSTARMASAFAALGHEVAVFSFERGEDKDFESGRLYSAVEEGRHSSKRNLDRLLKVYEACQPNIVINQMPYEHSISAVLRDCNPALLIGCLRNSLFSVKNNLDAYGYRVLPKYLSALSNTALIQKLLLLFHKMRHKRDLLRILSTYDVFVLYAPPNLDEVEFFVPDVEAGKLALIPNSIPTVVEQVPKKKKQILWLGRLDYEQKRSDLILPLWELISRELPDWHLDIVGNGPARSELEGDVVRRGLKRVRIVGQQQPDVYYREASIFVLTSAFEGFGNVIIEAQSFGAVPVLFDSFPNAQWIVKHGHNGFLIAPFDLAAMAEQVVAVARDTDIERLMCNAIENAQRFHVDQVAKLWQELFDKRLVSLGDG